MANRPRKSTSSRTACPSIFLFCSTETRRSPKPGRSACSPPALCLDRTGRYGTRRWGYWSGKTHRSSSCLRRSLASPDVLVSSLAGTLHIVVVAAGEDTHAPSAHLDHTLGKAAQKRAV